MTTECEDAYLKMKEMFDETAESEEPMTAKEVMDEVLGHKSGYCKGMGYGPSIPSTKMSHMESENAQLKELTNRMGKENSELSQQVKELKEAQVVFQKFMHDQLRKESESRDDSWYVAAIEMMIAFYNLTDFICSGDGEEQWRGGGDESIKHQAVQRVGGGGGMVVVVDSLGDLTEEGSLFDSSRLQTQQLRRLPVGGKGAGEEE
ncbi:hypothetical protein LINPERHAP2_LOCUS6438 [Linum perenne]